MDSEATLALVGIALPLGIGLVVWLLQRRAQWRDWARTTWRRIHGWKGIGIALLVVGALVLIFPWPEWYIPHDAPARLSLVNEYRFTAATIVGGLAVFLTLYLNWRRTVASEQGQITERFTRAIDQLGAMKGDRPNIEVRIGGIYALEQIAKDEPAKFHWQIMEVLCAYVRENHRFDEFPRDGDPPPTEKNWLDVQAALTVIGRREVEHDGGRPLDLSRTDLRGYSLYKARLERANLVEVYLQGANLGMAHLEGALLLRAKLMGANLHLAVLQGPIHRLRYMQGRAITADLLDANLEGARRLHDTDVRRWGWQADADGRLRRIPDAEEPG